jgi:hypothetical protein
MDLIKFNEMDIPVKELETIGLAVNGQMLLNEDDLKALLSGRRTGLLNLQNLEAENIRIKSLDAKISLHTNDQGKLDLLIHPIYRKPATPDFLDDYEAKQLEKGDVPNLLKTTVGEKGQRKDILVEYDKETREFIVSDTEKISAPDMVNNEYLTAAQKENYRKGREVALPDRTVMQYSGTDVKGIRSNRLALIASILIDGGLSYMVYRGLNALFNKERDQKDAETLSPGYYKALEDIEDQSPVTNNDHIRFDKKQQPGR